jgi:hypothetical protein
MSPENPNAINLHNLAATAAAYDVASFLGPDVVATMPPMHAAGPDGRTVADMINAERPNPAFTEMRREYTAQALAAVLSPGEITQE